MPIPDSAFRHCPQLLGRVQDPATSQFRRMEERYAEYDRLAQEQGRVNWRLRDEEREETRFEALKGRMGEDLWVFGYGSLIWDPGMHVDEFRRAAATGFRRRFCIHLEGGRGTPERPGLMAALDRGEDCVCEGVVMRVPGAIMAEETRLMWMREMIAGSYIPAFIPLDTPQGEVEALAFLARHDDERFVDLDLRQEVERISFAEGSLGTNLEYLARMVAQLETLGIHDVEMAKLLAACEARRAAAGMGDVGAREGAAKDLPGAP